MTTPITVFVTISAPLIKVWEAFTDATQIPHWYFASDDWEAPFAKNPLGVGETFTIRMSAKDGSEGFDLKGTYTDIQDQKRIAYTMEDGRKVEILFAEILGKTQVTETFDPENVYPHAQQKAGWQAILENLKKYVEGKE